MARKLVIGLHVVSICGGRGVQQSSCIEGVCPPHSVQFFVMQNAFSAVVSSESTRHVLNCQLLCILLILSGSHTS